METAFPIQESDNSISLATLVRRAGLTASAATLLLTGCSSHDASSAPEPTKPTTAAASTEASTTTPTCTVGGKKTHVAKAGDFTFTAYFPVSDSIKSPVITLTSEEQFGLGNMEAPETPGNWVTIFPRQPSSNNQAIREDDQFVMAFTNPQLSEHAGHLLVQGHSDAPVVCEVAN